jgi:hypothetical protein
MTAGSHFPRRKTVLKASEQGEGGQPRPEDPRDVQSHARQRALRWYGKDLSMGLLVRQVRDGKGKLLAEEPDGCGWWDVHYEPPDGQPAFVVRALLSADRRFAITVVPTRSLEQAVRADRDCRIKTEAQRQSRALFGVDLDMAHVVMLVRLGKAKCVADAGLGCKWYDVPYELPGQPAFTVRVLMNARGMFVKEVMRPPASGGTALGNLLSDRSKEELRKFSSASLSPGSSGPEWEREP